MRFLRRFAIVVCLFDGHIRTGTTVLFPQTRTTRWRRREIRCDRCNWLLEEREWTEHYDSKKGWEEAPVLPKRNEVK